MKNLSVDVDPQDIEVEEPIVQEVEKEEFKENLKTDIEEQTKKPKPETISMQMFLVVMVILVTAIIIYLNNKKND